MTTFTVTTADDIVNAGDGVLSLREAVARSNATESVDNIVFANAIEGQTLHLTGGQLGINLDVNIDGDRNNDGVGITIDADSDSRIFRIVGNTSLTDLHLVNGVVDSDENGGGLLVLGSVDVSLNNCSIENCGTGSSGDYGSGAGGAIYVAIQTTLTINDSSLTNNYSYNGAALFASDDATVNLQSSLVSGNYGSYTSAIRITNNSSILVDNSDIGDNGAGGLSVEQSDARIANSVIHGNAGPDGGGIRGFYSDIVLDSSTVADNRIAAYYTGNGAGIYARGGTIDISNSTITGNVNDSNHADDVGSGGGIIAILASLEMSNTIVAGNLAYNDAFDLAPSDLVGAITLSNGHNVFGSDVAGSVAGDREGIDPAAIFAAIDPDTGGGRLNADGTALLRADVANPALGGADRLLFMSADQLGAPRPQPSDGNADAGASESAFQLSTVASANNDLLTGSAGANLINGLEGHDFIRGLAGVDTINGGDGGDFLVGGTGNDRLNGNSGIDLVGYADTGAAVTVDLRGDGAGERDTATRGTEADTLTGIEGAIGSSGDDRFFGDNAANWFQGGGGKDTFTGGSGRDLYDFNLASASPVGGGRDVITDFDHLVDKFDLAGIDADATRAGNQAFHFVGSDALAGPGEVGFFTAGGNTIIRGSTDADAASEFEIQLSGLRAVTVQDFYL